MSADLAPGRTITTPTLFPLAIRDEKISFALIINSMAVTVFMAVGYTTPIMQLLPSRTFLDHLVFLPVRRRSILPVVVHRNIPAGIFRLTWSAPSHQPS